MPNPVGWIDPFGLACKELYESTHLLPRYEGEDDPNNPYRWNSVFGNVCTYLDEVQRRAYEVTVQNGLLAHVAGNNAGQAVDTTTMMSLHGGGSGTAIFVMSPAGQIYLGAHASMPGEFHHSSFLAGGAVASAGEIIVRDGKVLEVSNSSGHYWPKQSLNNQLFVELERQGMDESDVGNIFRSGLNDNQKPMTKQKHARFINSPKRDTDYIPDDWMDF